MVEKLTKYDVATRPCFDGGSETISFESDTGKFFKVEDVDAILNYHQQLKAEIAALITEFLHYSDHSMSQVAVFIHKLRQLSAV